MQQRRRRRTYRQGARRRPGRVTTSQSYALSSCACQPAAGRASCLPAAGAHVPGRHRTRRQARTTHFRERPGRRRHVGATEREGRTTGPGLRGARRLSDRRLHPGTPWRAPINTRPVTGARLLDSLRSARLRHRAAQVTNRRTVPGRATRPTCRGTLGGSSVVTIVMN